VVVKSTTMLGIEGRKISEIKIAVIEIKIIIITVKSPLFDNFSSDKAIINYPLNYSRENSKSYINSFSTQIERENFSMKIQRLKNII
jgi:hypothetical protein